MHNKIENLIEFSSESATLDFKQIEYPIEQHAKKHELIKDICAFANHPSNEDKFIIIGVKEVGGQAKDFINVESPTDEAKYQQLIDSCIEPKINFEYKPVDYNGFKLMYFRFFDNSDRPYLLKKNIQNFTDPQKNEFREGDGFIRTGTSTKKISRTILDKIYANKYALIDRKTDLNVTHIIKKSDTEWDVNFIEFDIENTSKKSISLNAELKIMKDSTFKIIEKNDFEYELKIAQEKKVKKKSPFTDTFAPFITKDLNLHVSFEESVDYYLIKRNSILSTTHAISIAQMDLEKNVFCKSIIILGKPNKIKCELILRSDDFVEGSFSKIFDLDTNIV